MSQSLILSDLKKRLLSLTSFHPLQQSVTSEERLGDTYLITSMQWRQAVLSLE